MCNMNDAFTGYSFSLFFTLFLVVAKKKRKRKIKFVELLSNIWNSLETTSHLHTTQWQNDQSKKMLGINHIRKSTVAFKPQNFKN